MRKPLGELTMSEILGLQARLAQEGGQECGPRRYGVDAHVFVRGMRASSFGAEAVEHGDAERADEVAVGAARDGRLAEVETELAPVLARAGESACGAGGALERRPRPAALEADGSAGR